MQIAIPNKCEVTVAAGPAIKVAASDELVAAIDRLFGEKVAELC